MELTKEEFSIKEVVAKELIIEEINRNHKLLHRHKLDKPSINIGRDYHNDIILADPHVCPSHISIDFIDEQWQITDNQTVNGTFVENIKEKKHAANQHIVCDGDVISLGKSQLRLLFSDHTVEATVAFSPFESFINLMRHPLALFISITFFTLIAGSIIYFNKPIAVNFSQLFVPAIGMSLGFALWPAGVALVSHLSKQDARLMAQLGVSFALFNLMWFSDILETIVTFNSSSDTILPMLVTFTSVILAFSLFWLNSYIGFHMGSKRRIVVSASITLLLFGGSYLIQYSKQPDFNPRPNYNATIMMPSFLFTTSSSVDEFIDNSSKLFDKTKKEALSE
ncbi:MAG: FHA domain-containing protein [Colwellia sp.]|nr:FHA domain-containing protein [Colwellia sp.]